MQNIETLLAAATRARTGRRQTHPNKEGAPAFFRPLREQVVQVLSTGTLADTFYVSGAQLAREAIDVLVRARKECPEFLARALVWAREQGCMKTLPVLGLVVLSGGRGRTKALFETCFPRVIRTPDDLRAFAALSAAGVVPGRKGLGGVAAVAVRQWMNEIGEYHTVKYGSAASRVITLRDIIRMTHPQSGAADVRERLGWLAKGNAALTDDVALNPQIRAFEALKSATTEDAQLTLIREGRLPFEAVIPALTAATPAIWSALLRTAPYLNLLRSLATFTRHGVFADEANVRYAVERLTDPRAVERSMVFPFRFFHAHRAYTRLPERDSHIADALRAGLDLSFANAPSLGDRTVALGIDVSGSMGNPIPRKPVRRNEYGAPRPDGLCYVDIAGVFAGALLRRVAGRVIPLPFSDRVHLDADLSARDDVLVSAQKIAHLCGGGTALAAPVGHLHDRVIAADVFIGITDQEDWAYGDRGSSVRRPFLDAWLRYRREIAPHAQAFLMTIAPYCDAVAPPATKGVHFIYGWSDVVLKYIAQQLATGESQVQAIEAMVLDAACDPNGIPLDDDLRDAQAEDASTE